MTGRILLLLAWPPFLRLSFKEELLFLLTLFLVEVFDYFNVVCFQFIPNLILTMVAFYIAFIEVDIGEPSVVEFAYIYCIKALARNDGF